MTSGSSASGIVKQWIRKGFRAISDSEPRTGAMLRSRNVVTALLVGVCCAFWVIAAGAAKIKVDVKFDKAVDFKAFRTFRWHPQGAGDVKLFQATNDKPADLRAKFEPVILPIVEQTLGTRGLTKSTAAAADLNVSYYVLIGPNISSQTMGQFMRPVPEWGLPPFAPATSALEIYEQGTLILDIAAAAEDKMIWRGSAKAEIDRQNSDAVRNERIRSAVQDMLKKFPPKK